MRIKELHLKNFRCFEELDITFPESNLAVFIGLNGSGKTAILDAITSEFMYGMSSVIGQIYANENKEFTIGISDEDSIKTNLDNISIGFLDMSVEMTLEHKEESVSSKFIYSKNRPTSIDISIIKSSNTSIQKPDEFFNSFICISYDALKQKIHSINESGGSHIFTFEGFESWFEEEENIENELISDKKDFSFTNPKLNVARKAMSLFLSHLSNANFHDLKVKRVYNATERMGTYEEEIKKHESFLVIKKSEKQLKLSQFSAGEQLLLHIVGDISYKLVIANDELEENDYYCDTILASSGIVLIDEIELHLHPQWQREVLPALQKTFPNIQFIVTTHSPQVLSNLKKEEIFILEDNKIVEVTPHVEGRDANSILYELFGVKDRPEHYKNRLNELYKAIEDEQLDDAKRILAELTQLWGEQDTEIVSANLHLSFAEE